MRVLTRLMLAAVALGALAAAQGQSRPDLQLKAAVYKETVEGDLKGAADLYKQVASNADTPRQVAAAALLGLGGCYEKLGGEQARGVYERLITDFPEQTQEVARARDRLAALAKSLEPQKPVFRRIHIPTKLPGFGSGKLSPDGQTLAFISGGSLWTVPVHGKSDPDIAGAPTRLTEPMHAWDNANVSVEWSADSKWIAFRAAVPGSDRNVGEEIHLVPAEGGAPKRLPISWKDWADDVYTLRYALSANAETLYFAAGTTHDALRIYSMSAAGGTWKALTEPTARQPVLSPDGSRIAYVKMIRDPNYDRFDDLEIWVGPANGGTGNRVFGSADMWVQGPVWSPDGRVLAFLASKRRTYLRQVVVLPVRSDGTTGEARAFDLPAWTSAIMPGWTTDNRLGILVPAEQQTAIYTVPATGGRATQLTTRYAAVPNWTRDGKAIYFDGAHGSDRAAIEFIPAAGGKVTRVPIDKEFEFLQPSYPLAGISLSPDGKTICYAAFYRVRGEPGSAIYLLPKEGGRPERLTTNAMGDYEPVWSPNGREIAFIRREHAPGEQVIANIYVVSREGGEARRITTAEDKVQLASMDWSPDGESIAFYGRGDEKLPSPCLRVIPAKGGRSQILVPTISAPGLYWAGLAWSPDGQRLAYVSEAVLWTIPRSGGQPTLVETGLDNSRMAKIDWSPDGRTIVFEATTGGEHELWLMEDFIHLVKGGR